MLERLKVRAHERSQLWMEGRQWGEKGGYFHCLSSVQTCRWRRRGEGFGRSAVFSRRSFLCVGLMAPNGGRNPQPNLLSPQNTLCYKTHTPSGTDPALNFLPVILAAGQRKKAASKQRRPDNHSLLRSRGDNHASWYKTEVVKREMKRDQGQHKT